MLISIENFRRCESKHPNWCLKNHLDNIYMIFKNYSYENKYLKTQLIKWRANRGASVDWEAFFSRKNKLLQKLPRNINLVNLEVDQVSLIVEIVKELDKFKCCRPTMVFGAKVAHFHHPHLVPVLDRKVREALNKWERYHPEEIQRIRGWEKDRGRLYFPKEGEGGRVFKNYLVLGNYCLRHNSEEMGPVISYIEEHNISQDISQRLPAKIFEWCLLGWAERGEPE